MTSPCSSLSSTKFSVHFNSEINNLKSSVPYLDFDIDGLMNYCENKCWFNCPQDIPFITITEVHKYLSSLKNNNSSGLDGISNKILCTSASVICTSSTYIYNWCIAMHYFPKAFKIAKVYPRFKPGSLCRDDLNNYRPISILSSLSKPVEKHIHKNIWQEMVSSWIVNLDLGWNILVTRH